MTKKKKAVEEIELESKEEIKLIEYKKVEKKTVFYTLDEYGIIRNINRGKLASFRVGTKKLESRTLDDWDKAYNDFYNEKRR